MEEQEKICRLCLKNCGNDFMAIEKNVTEILVFLLKSNPFINEESVMCANCSESIKDCYHFKRISLDVEDSVVELINRSDSDATLKEANEDDHEICRLCMGSLNICSFISVDSKLDKTTLDQIMLNKCLPELDKRVAKPIICVPCRVSLQRYFDLITNFSIVEEKIKKYCEATRTGATGPIILKDVLKFTTKNTLDMVDSIKMEDKFCEDEYVDEQKCNDELCPLEKISTNIDVEKINGIKTGTVLEELDCKIEVKSEDFMKIEDHQSSNMPKFTIKCKEDDGHQVDVVEMEQLYCQKGVNEVELKQQNLYRNMAPKKNYAQAQMAAALEAVAKGMPVAAAAKEFAVPRTTLAYKASGKSPKKCPMGPKTYLTNIEESSLVDWILSLAKKHYPVAKEQLLDSVQMIIRNTKRQTPFIDCRPGRKWYQSFLRRHPELSCRLTQNLTPARENVTENQIRSWFAEMAEYLKSKDLFKVANIQSRVFNCDENAVFLQPKGEKVLARKRDKNVYSAGTNDEKEHLTVLVTANANGDIAPPMVVFKCQKIPSHIAYSLNTKWGIGRSDSGWMCGSTFYEYVTNIFVPWLNDQNIERPVLLFVDGHLSHMTLSLSQYCSESGIELIALYPNSTHLIQPVDVAIFEPLKSFWKQSVRKWHAENCGSKFRKEDFGILFEQALNKVTKESIRNGFKACGLSPFGTNNIIFSNIPTTKSSTHSNTNIHEKQKLKKCLKVLEDHIAKETLDKFKDGEDNDKWLGDVEDTTLFEVWQKINNKLRTMDEDNEREEEMEGTKDTDNATVSEDPEIKNNNSNNEVRPEHNGDNLHNIASPMPSTSHMLVARQHERLGYQTPKLKKDPPVSAFKKQPPTAFKKALFVPEPPVKKKQKEKITSAITSKARQEYHKRKQKGKDRKEMEKKEREVKGKDVELKKKGKATETENRKGKIKKQNTLKRKRQNSGSETTEDDKESTC